MTTKKHTINFNLGGGGGENIIDEKFQTSISCFTHPNGANSIVIHHKEFVLYNNGTLHADSAVLRLPPNVAIDMCRAILGMLEVTG